MKGKRIKKSVKPPAAPAKEKKDTNQEPMGDKPFDFGGIPERNLKKNLGCG
jgi:hypothetical protein